MLQPPSGLGQPGDYHRSANIRSSENLLNSGGADRTYPFAVTGTAAASASAYRGGPAASADALWSSDPAPIGAYEMHSLPQQRYDAWGQPKSFRKKWVVSNLLCPVPSTFFFFGSQNYIIRSSLSSSLSVLSHSAESLLALC